jgi:hypothetical protein
MSLFNDTLPSDDESVKLGASRIRETKTTLNTLLSQIFTDALAFLPNWITGPMIAGDPAVDANRAITSDNLKNGSVILRTMPDGVFTADITGRAKFATGFVNGAMIDPGLVLPVGIITTANIADGAVTATQIGALAATIAKVGAGVAKIAIGSYAGSNSVSASVTGVAFAPDFVLLVGGSTSNQVGVSFRNEISGGASPIHTIGSSEAIVFPDSTALQWTSDGFVVVPTNYTFNRGSRTHAYLALGV